MLDEIIIRKLHCKPVRAVNIHKDCTNSIKIYKNIEDVRKNKEWNENRCDWSIIENFTPSWLY